MNYKRKIKLSTSITILRNIINIFSTLLSLLVAQIALGQNSHCDKYKISQADKMQIEQFWTNFKDAINKEDKAKLALLIKFPFDCDYCSLDSSKNKNYDDMPVTQQAFIQTQYKIFLTTNLKKIVNKYPKLFDILFTTTTTSQKTCNLNFAFTSVEPSKDREGQQHVFTINNFKDKFLIASAWTIP